MNEYSRRVAELQSHRFVGREEACSVEAYEYRSRETI